MLELVIKPKIAPFLGIKLIWPFLNRIITAAVVTGGEKVDGAYLEALVTEANDNGMDVSEIVGDRAYSGKGNLQFTRKNNIDLISRLTPVVTKGFRSPDEIWDYNKDSGMFICPAGHMAEQKVIINKYDQKKNKVEKYYFDVNKCQNCTLKNGCYRPGAKTKTYSVTIKSDEHSSQEMFEKTEYFNKHTKKRYKIEAKNSEMKNRHGYNQSWSNGISSMTLQGAVTIFCVNMKRIMKLIDEK